MSTETYDVLIVGAGLSGIGAAAQLARAFPQKRITILERRNSIGGTWDLFRYPGIRSDSDMFTFGYKFHPWNDLQVLADGSSIRHYIRQTAQTYGVDRRIQYGLKTTGLDWSSAQRQWTVTALHEASGETRRFHAKFVVTCTGYYNYDAGYLPEFPGIEHFRGQRIHPQHWPEHLDYRGKRVVVIGSGATAVTLVPAMAEAAGHVTMLQRSPSYIFSMPGRDRLTGALTKLMPASWAYALARRRNIVIQRLLFTACKRWPQMMRRWLLSAVRKQVGDSVDMRHFTPRYMPWDERLCAVPDADLFRALRKGKAEVVTDQIETFTEDGIRLKSGRELNADIVITATGLSLQILGGAEIAIDGAPCALNRKMTYKGVLLQDVPNLAWVFGYTNAPWTLKADITAEYLVRLLRHMDQRGIDVVTARDREGCAIDDGIMDALQSGYVQRYRDQMPRQGSKLPWKVLNHYARDRKMLTEEPVDDGILSFTPAVDAQRAGDATVARAA